MIKRGYQQSQGDHTLLINHFTQSKVIVLVAYVDDIVVIRDDLEENGKLKSTLQMNLKLKTMEVLETSEKLRLQGQNRGCLFLSKNMYLIYLRRRFTWL